MEEKLLYESESYEIRGAIYEVYREMGIGLLEAVYQECLEEEFQRRNITFDTQKSLSLIYKGKKLQHTYRPDLICYDKIILEIKAVDSLTGAHTAQLHNYLRLTGYRLGFLINFNHFPGAEIKRIII